MDLVLTIIGVLGLGALAIAVWVFASAAKRYVTGEDIREEMQALQSDLSPYRHWVDRSRADRRIHDAPNVFPININGEVVRQERRVHDDRRHAG